MGRGVTPVFPSLGTHTLPRAGPPDGRAAGKARRRFPVFARAGPQDHPRPPQQGGPSLSSCRVCRSFNLALLGRCRTAVVRVAPHASHAMRSFRPDNPGAPLVKRLDGRFCRCLMSALGESLGRGIPTLRPGGVS